MVLPSPREERVSQDALAELAIRVCERSFRRVWDLRLILREDGVILSGLADSYYAKQLAQHALLVEATFRLRANEIVVTG